MGSGEGLVCGGEGVVLLTKWFITGPVLGDCPCFNSV